MKFKFLIFDLDDTLFDAEAAYQHALRSVGIDPFSTDYSEARRTIKSRLPEGHVGARNRLLYFKTLLDRRGHYAHHRLLELMEQYEMHLSHHIKGQWQNLGRESLFKEKWAHLPKVILTNENLRTQMIKLRAIDPEGDQFPHVLTSEEMGVEKPNLTLFEAAIKILGCKPEDCVMIGDSLENDIAPASKMGMKACLTTEFRKSQKMDNIAKPIEIVNRLEELERIFS